MATARNSHTRVTFTITSDRHRELSDLAKATERSVAFVVREAVHAYLAQHRNEQAPLFNPPLNNNKKS